MSVAEHTSSNFNGLKSHKDRCTHEVGSCVHQYTYYCLVCLIQINYIYLYFFIFKLLYGLYLICKCTHTASIFFFIWSNSKLLCSDMQEYRNIYSI